MPTISMFYGIAIRMYWKDNKQAAYVKAWSLLHEDELSANWQLAFNHEETYRIEPLR